MIVCVRACVHARTWCVLQHSAMGQIIVLGILSSYFYHFWVHQRYLKTQHAITESEGFSIIKVKCHTDDPPHLSESSLYLLKHQYTLSYPRLGMKNLWRRFVLYCHLTFFSFAERGGPSLLLVMIHCLAVVFSASRKYPYLHWNWNAWNALGLGYISG